MLQRGFQIGQIQQQMQVQWVSRVMNTQQVLQLQFRGYTWNQVQGLVYQEIQRQILNINQERLNANQAMLKQQMMMNTTTMMGNLPSMMMRQPVTIQNKLNDTQIHGNLQLIRTTPNVANQVPLAQTSNKDINSVPKNPINDPIKGYLEEIKNYVQNKMPLLLNKDNLNDQSWSALVDIQGKLSSVLDSSDKSVGDYLKYSKCIDKFFEHLNSPPRAPALRGSPGGVLYGRCRGVGGDSGGFWEKQLLPPQIFAACDFRAISFLQQGFLLAFCCLSMVNELLAENH